MKSWTVKELAVTCGTIQCDFTQSVMWMENFIFFLTDMTKKVLLWVKYVHCWREDQDTEEVVVVAEGSGENGALWILYESKITMI